ncbi:hypothetical protein [Roseivirga sp.]|uniref:hypothetical protein n=1 Tax=Roseivirga sp. TaxID=1964215 RepID=UPI003B8E781C
MIKPSYSQCSFVCLLLIGLMNIQSCAVPALYHFNSQPYGSSLDQRIPNTLVVKIDESILSEMTVTQGGAKPFNVLQFRRSLFDNIKSAYTKQFAGVLFYDDNKDLNSGYVLEVDRFEPAFVQGNNQRDKNAAYDFTLASFSMKISYDVRLSTPNNSGKRFNDEVLSNDYATSVDHVHRVFKNAVKLSVEKMNSQTLEVLE